MPEMDTFSLNFQNAGYYSPLMLVNAQGFLLLYALSLGLLLLVPIFLSLGMYCSCAKRIDQLLRNHMFFNGSIRLFMGAYLDMMMFGLLNLVESPSFDFIDSVKASHYLSIAVVIFSLAVPIMLFAYICLKSKRLSDDKLYSKVGSLIQGSKRKSVKYPMIVIVVPIVFFTRRLSIVLTLVFWQEFIWGQVALQFMMCVGMIIFVQWFRPFDDAFSNTMETFNEIITLMILYMLFLFTDFVGAPATRRYLGFAYIGIILLYALVHLSVLFSDNYKKIKKRLKACKEKCKSKKAERAKEKKVVKQERLARQV